MSYDSSNSVLPQWIQDPAGFFKGPDKTSYTQNANLTDMLNQLQSKMTNLQPTNNPYLSQAGNYYNQVTSPGYSAMSQGQMNQMYNTQKNDLVNNSFIPNENRYAARMASLPGQSGSTYSSKKWNEDVIDPENTQLANLKQNIYNQNWQATQSNIQQANNLLPSLSSQYTSEQEYPLQMQLQYLNSLLGLNQTQNGSYLAQEQINNQQNAANSQAAGNIIGAILAYL